jgi:hypothetical protein
MTKRSLREKPFVVVDLFSGSYLLENEAHEKYNTVRNSFTGKYYAYGSSDAREKVLRKLYNIKYEDLRKIGINLSFDDLLSLYP